MPRNDVGSAFPFTVETSWQAKAQAQSVGMSLPNTSTVRGMSLRDYFAAKAMTVVMQTMFESMLKEPNLAREAATDCATFSYAMADAMLKERAK